jgi:hydroxymethylpyrimidine/phosphomethylpyrimidine kinase
MSSSPAPQPDAQADAGADDLQEATAPACVMSFNAADPSGAGGLAGDIATLAAMGAHALPITTSLMLRDTAEIFDHHPIDADTVAEQARNVLEDITVAGWKVGFLGSAEGVSAVAEILSDYPDVPLVSYLPNLGWLDDDQAQPYLEAFRDLILPATEVLVGNHKTLTDFLLPDWDSERPASARELAVAAGERGTRFVLVTGIMLPTKGGKGGKSAKAAAGAGSASGSEQFIDNVLASAQGALTGEKFEMFETAFVGAGDTLSAALAALLASGAELQAAVGEALAFMDQTLDAGFRPGMGSVVPDRFFWALPPAEEGEPGTEAVPDDSEAPDPESTNGKGSKPAPRRVH